MKKLIVASALALSLPAFVANAEDYPPGREREFMSKECYSFGTYAALVLKSRDEGMPEMEVRQFWMTATPSSDYMRRLYLSMSTTIARGFHSDLAGVNPIAAGSRVYWECMKERLGES